MGFGIEILIFVVVGVASLGLTALAAAALFTYVTRTWQVIRAESDESVQGRLLDGVDMVHQQLQILSDRLIKLEARLELGAGSTPQEPEPGQGGATPGGEKP